MNKELENKAFIWAKENRKIIVKEILSKYDNDYFKSKQIIFLSGSPGAGKTEVINGMMEEGFSKFFFHADLDEIRKLIPGYRGDESDSFHKGAIKIMEMLLDEVFRKGISVILDGTFGSKKVSLRNIDKAISKGYDIKIYYIKFDPILARKFTLGRELDQKRKVPFFSFMKQYYFSYFNIKRIIYDYKGIELKVFDKILSKSGHSAKIYTILSLNDFEKHKNSIQPNFNIIYLLYNLIILTIKYKFFVKNGLIPNDIKNEGKNIKRD